LRYSQHGRDHYRRTLSFRRLLHDDTEFNELWWYFLYWIAPFVETVGFVGYYRETFSLHPVTIYLKGGQIFKNNIESTPKGWYGEVWDGDAKTVQPGWISS
jgi:hypothetical protein